MTNRKLTVADAYEFNRAGTQRWIVFPLWRYELYLTGFIVKDKL